MNDKNYVIDSIEEALEKQEKIIERETESIKGMYNEIAETNKEIAEAELRVEGLKVALHKLKGLDNLEKKNIEHGKDENK